MAYTVQLCPPYLFKIGPISVSKTSCAVISIFLGISTNVSPVCKKIENTFFHFNNQRDNVQMLFFRYSEVNTVEKLPMIFCNIYFDKFALLVTLSNKFKAPRQKVNQTRVLMPYL